MTAAPHCEHTSFYICGECRAKEPKQVHTIAELEAQILALKALVPPPADLRLDLGCGNSVRRAITGLTKEKGWTGVDFAVGDGVDVACDLGKDRWPWEDSSVTEVMCNHMLEHVPAKQRIHFFNELWRVLKNGGKASITTPHWCSCRAYGDVTHEWPPVSEMFWQYLNKEWRDVNAPHVGFHCNFAIGYGYITAAWLQGRNAEYVQEAVTKYKEAAQDMAATLTAVKA